MSFSNDPAQLLNQLPIALELPEDPKLLREELTLLLKRISDSVNTKEGSIYSLEEKGNFKRYYKLNDFYSFRDVYRKTFDLVNLNGGNIAGGATVNFAHDITGITESAMIYASCSSVTSQYFTVVYPNVYVLGANIFFTNPLPATALRSVIAVVEVLKD